MHVDPREALRQARRSLTEGHFENGHPAGAQANATESIAWSLIGILRHLEGPRTGLQEGLEQAGFLRLDRHR